MRKQEQRRRTTMANASYTNTTAHQTYKQAEQAVLEVKAQRQELQKEGERAAERAKRETVGTLKEKLAAIRAAWAPFNEKIAELDAAIEKNYKIADENFDVWKGLK
jgi:hypothetical protein